MRCTTRTERTESRGWIEEKKWVNLYTFFFYVIQPSYRLKRGHEMLFGSILCEGCEGVRRGEQKRN